MVYASAEICECSLLSTDDFEKTREQHRHIGKAPPYETLYGLVLRNISELATPVPHYRKPATCNWTLFKTQEEDRIPRRKRAAPSRQRSSEALQDGEKHYEETEEEEPAQRDLQPKKSSKPATALPKTALRHKLPNKK